MTRTVEPPHNCRCVPCDWAMADHSECYGCDGSGFETKCDACFGPECTACEERAKEPKRDTDGLPFCDGCFEELKGEEECRQRMSNTRSI